MERNHTSNSETFCQKQDRPHRLSGTFFLAMAVVFAALLVMFVLGIGRTEAFHAEAISAVMRMENFSKVIVLVTILSALGVVSWGAVSLARVKRKFNEEHQRVEEQLAMEYLQSNIIARFVDYEPEQWESLIHQSLEDICNYTKASSVYSVGYSESEREIKDIYGWSTLFGTEGYKFFKEFRFENVLWWVENLRKGEPIVMTGDMLPDEAEVPRRLYERFNTKSMLVVPMCYSGEARGALLIAHRSSPMDWKPKQIDCMKLVANILATAIMRHQVEKEVREYTEKLAQNNIRLQQARTKAEEAARTKGEFLANMSHEIRTPMTAILGFAENLISPNLSDEDRRDAADTICRNGNYLLQLINDILDFSKVEAGQIKLEKIPCPPIRIVNDILLLMMKRAKEKNIFLKTMFRGPMPEEFETDPTRLRQIILNLVGNAVKFTEQGGVTISNSVEKDDDGNYRFVCEVNDTGIGMDEVQLKRVFQPFTQADSSVTRRYGGTGLGLAISLRLAEAMGGSLKVESVPSVATIFWLTIPVTIREGAKWIEDPAHYKFVPPTPPSESGEPRDLTESTESTENLSENPVSPVACDRFPGKIPVAGDGANGLRIGSKPSESVAKKSGGSLPYRILLAEDGQDNQRLISILLRKEGATVEVVENGSEAILAIEQAEVVGNPFDIVLMDMQMPVLDGYAATRRLRQAGFHLPIIALTASVMPNDRNRCIAAGCNDYAMKPINRESLFATIRKNVEESKSASY